MVCPTTIFLLSTITTVTTKSLSLPVTLIATVSYVNLTTTSGTLSALAKELLLTLFWAKATFSGNQQYMTFTATASWPGTITTITKTLTSVRPLDVLSELGSRANITWPSMTEILPCSTTQAYLVTITNGTITTVESLSVTQTNTAVPFALLAFAVPGVLNSLGRRRKKGRN